jgi:hypothetical protein
MTTTNNLCMEIKSLKEQIEYQRQIGWEKRDLD